MRTSPVPTIPSPALWPQEWQRPSSSSKEALAEESAQRSPLSLLFAAPERDYPQTPSLPTMPRPSAPSSDGNAVTATDRVSGIDVQPGMSFAEFQRETCRVRVRNQGALFVVVFTLALIGDYLRLGSTPQFEFIRNGVPLQILICGLCFALLQFHEASKKRPLLIAALSYPLMCGIGGWVLGHLGGFDGPYFYAAYILPTFLMTVPLQPTFRLTLTAVMVAAFVGFFLLPNPQHLDHAHVSIAFNYLLSITALDIFVGHQNFALTRRTFRMAQALDVARAKAEAQGAQLRQHLTAQAERVRTLADEADGARSSEREELARTLHDDVGQLLLATRLQLANAERRIEDAATEDGSFDSLHELLQQLEGSMRGLIVDLRKEEHERPMSQKLEEFIRVAREEADLDVRLELPPASTVPLRFRSPLARFVQEGLTNVVKHADATSVLVRVEVDEHKLQAKVIDDGIGPGGADDDPGWGLLGLRERLEALGGTLSLRPGPSGSILEMKVPFDATSTAGGAA